MSKNTNRPRRKPKNRSISNPERQPFSKDVRALGRIVAALRGLECDYQRRRVIAAACIFVGTRAAALSELVP